MSSVPRTWVPGESVGSALLNAEIRDRWNEAYYWGNYTPTWGAASGSPTLGNGTLWGRYFQAGNVCTFWAYLTIGSTSSMGTSTGWTLTLPVAASQSPVFSALAADTGTAWYASTAFIATTTTIYFTGSSGTRVGYNNPFTWATGDYLRVGGTYEV